MKKKTQKQMILEHLKKSPISTWTSIYSYGCTRLSDVIYKLKKDGHCITSELQHRPNGKSFALYTLES